MGLACSIHPLYPSGEMIEVSTAMLWGRQENPRGPL